MAIDLLDTPLRLTWDLHGPETVPDDSRLLAIAGRIVDAGVFFVTLEERPLAHRALPALVELLAAGGCRVAAVCHGAPEELAALRRPLALSAVQLDVAPFLNGATLSRQLLAEVFAALCDGGCAPALRLTPLRTNLAVIPELLRFATELGARSFKLPNARIGDTFPGYPPEALPHWRDLEAFRQVWQAARISAAELPQLEIHDRFLWEIMTPGDDQARSEYGGCQAGNSLGHIDACGRLYPCAAWPVPLGTLPDSTIEDLWQVPQRFAVRAAVADVPAGCAGCRDYPLCLGGCRGLGELLNVADGCRDPMCHEPRR